MTRKDVLDAALKCVNGDRDMQYGSPEDSFKIIAELWNAYIKGTNPSGITESFGIGYSDVAAMLALMKIARIAGGTPKEDNWIDLAGYAACGGEIESKLLEKTAESYANIKTRELLDNVVCNASNQNLHDQRVTL